MDSIMTIANLGVCGVNHGLTDMLDMVIIVTLSGANAFRVLLRLCLR